VSVVIVIYNDWPDAVRLVQVLACAAEVQAGQAEIVLVDNASQGPIPPELHAPAPGVFLVQRGHNGGFAAGVNSGWHAARGRWLVLLNPDVVVAEGWLAELFARVRRLEAAPAPAPGIVGFGLRNADGSRQPSVGSFPSLPRTLWEQLIPRSRRKYQADWRTRPGPVPWVTGACMLVNTRMLAELGGMDEDFFLYYEEVALCRSALRAGWRVEYDPGLAATHLYPLQNRALSPKMRVITRHSKLLYFRKHLPPWQFLALSWIITIEAMIVGGWSRLRGETDEARAWGTIGRMTRAFRAGEPPRGIGVQVLAEAVAGPAAPPSLPAGGRSHDLPVGTAAARKRRGVRTG
jgi:GT2 family glycosyltransferase